MIKTLLQIFYLFFIIGTLIAVIIGKPMEDDVSIDRLFVHIEHLMIVGIVSLLLTVLYVNFQPTLGVKEKIKISILLIIFNIYSLFYYLFISDNFKEKQLSKKVKLFDFIFASVISVYLIMVIYMILGYQIEQIKVFLIPFSFLFCIIMFWFIKDIIESRISLKYKIIWIFFLFIIPLITIPFYYYMNKRPELLG